MPNENIAAMGLPKLHRVNWNKHPNIVYAFWLALWPIVATCLGYAIRRWLTRILASQSDSHLAIALYIVGGTFALLGCVVSVHPPKKATIKGIFIALFGFVFYIGFLITSLQARRLEEMTLRQGRRLEEAMQRDTANKLAYDSDLKELQGEIKGMYGTIVALAKQPSSEKWNSLLNSLHTLAGRSQQQVIPVLPASTGNVKERTLALAHDLLYRIYARGYREGSPEAKAELDGQLPFEDDPHLKPNPDQGQQIQLWFKHMSDYFKIMQLQQVIDIHRELLEFHLRDRQLDDSLKFNEMDPQREIGPNEIEIVGESLRNLANEIP